MAFAGDQRRARSPSKKTSVASLAVAARDDDGTRAEGVQRPRELLGVRVAVGLPREHPRLRQVRA